MWSLGGMVIYIHDFLDPNPPLLSLSFFSFFKYPRCVRMYSRYTNMLIIVRMYYLLENEINLRAY